MKQLIIKQRVSFREMVLRVVRDIPKGKTLSYKQVATRAGSPNASRAVGMIMSRNRDKSIPCHRVVRSDGTMAGYNGIRTNGWGGMEAKQHLLQQEGVKI